MPETKEQPPNNKPKQVDPRAIRRQHKWRFGHDPNDPDATPESGWVYLRTEYTGSPTPPNQAKGLGGGPEAFPCPDCGGIMRIVAEKKPTEIIANSDVIRLGEEVDQEKVNEDTIFLVACPKCNRKQQIPGKFLRDLRWRTLGKEFTY